MRWPWRRSGKPRQPLVPENLPTDPLRVFRALERHGVEYLAIGGIAVQAHGHVRTTQDVDILAAPGADNLGRLAAALKELHARLKGVDAHLLGIDPTDAQTLHDGANFTLATTAGTLDIWTDAAELKGAAPWPELRKRALQATVAEGIRVRVVGRDDLISLKRAAAANRDSAEKRAQDEKDIAVLSDPGRFTRRAEPHDGPSRSGGRRDADHGREDEPR